MLYTVINVVLIVALAATSVFALVMYREFRRFRFHSGEYASALQETARAMDGVERAVAHVHGDGAQTLIALGERIDAAHRTLTSLKTAETAATVQLRRLEKRIDEAGALAAKAQPAQDKTGLALEKAGRRQLADEAVIWPVVRGAGAGAGAREA
ncbi:MAG: hypothetical protein EA385_09925 [Salinarimonadaceae bacterium]|nr:MAG: hypothetical protein EA385_09925 [Salinarimonadaceae bacterium]